MEAVPFDWEKVLAIYGPLGAFSALFGYLIWKYVPRVVDNHLQFTSTIEAQGERATAAVEKLSGVMTNMVKGEGDEYRDHVFSSYRTNRAINSMADAIQAGANELDQKVSNAVRPHVAAIKDAINSKNAG